MKKIGNLYELINAALHDGFKFFNESDERILEIEDKLDELVSEYGEVLTEGSWKAIDEETNGNVQRYLINTDDERDYYLLVKN